MLRFGNIKSKTKEFFRALYVTIGQLAKNYKEDIGEENVWMFR